MRGEAMKKAVQEISKHAYYAVTSIACEKAMHEDTPEGYAVALSQIADNKGEYAVNVDKAKAALRDDG
jgi:hypothetical protein